MKKKTMTPTQARREELAAIVESSPDAIMTRTLDGTITTWNAGAARMFGYTAQEAVGKPIWLIVPPDKQEEVKKTQERVYVGELIEPFESVRLTREGRRLPVSVTVSAIRDPHGAVVGSATSFRDLTEVHRAKQALEIEVQQKDAFLAMLSHELRGPLAPLRMALDMIDAPTATREQVEKSKAMMGRQLAHLTSVVDQLLDVSRSRGGLGLGLALTKGLIELHGGTVEARSEGVGRGSLFTIRLPAIPGAKPEPGSVPAVSREPASSGQWHILVIEDNLDAAESLKDALLLAGHKVTVASDGETALGLARELKPEVVLCDIGLPGTMDGYMVAKAFRADAGLRDVHLVAVSGYGQPQDQKRARDSGFELHFRKPTDISALTRGLSSLREVKT